MNVKGSSTDEVRLIRFAAWLWLGYLALLVFLNQGFNQPRQVPPGGLSQPGSYLYYILLGGVALACLGLAYWPYAQRALRRAFVPLIITLVTVAPVVISNLTGRFPLGPRFTSPEGSVLAIFPFLFVGLLLVAWQYKWQYILLVILGITAVNLAITWGSAGPGTPPFQGVLAVTLIQTVIFLAVGFSISYLVGRLRGQRRSLEAANLRLTHYASTLEQLATSRERNRLALELHDTLAHTLSGLAVQLETVNAYWDVDAPKARTLLEKSLESARTGLEETRRALKALRASPLDDLGLANALANLARDTAARAGLDLDLSISEALPALSPDVEQSVYRVAQEALANVVKHASARNLTFKLENSGGKVNLLVSDDGVGFEPARVEQAGHFGLAGMRDRARLTGGALEIRSAPGAGTTVLMTV